MPELNRQHTDTVANQEEIMRWKNKKKNNKKEISAIE